MNPKRDIWVIIFTTNIYKAQKISFSPLGEKGFAAERQAHPILDQPRKIHNFPDSDLHGPHHRNFYDFSNLFIFPDSTM